MIEKMHVLAVRSEVELGDFIFAINGPSGKASEFLDIITTEATLDMSVIRRVTLRSPP